MDAPLPPLPAALTARGIALRPEAAGDRAFLIDLYAQQRGAELAAVPWDAIARVRFLADQFALQVAHYAALGAGVDRWIVTDAATPIGRLYLGRGGPGDWRLMEIGLIVAAQGRGLGSALIGWAIAAAGAAGRGVAVQVLPDNAGAIALYRRLGFRHVRAGDGAAGRIAMRRPADRGRAARG